MSTARCALSFMAFAALILVGCGATVPDIQEVGDDDAQGDLLVKAIVGSIHCELRNAINSVIDNDIESSRASKTPRQAAYLDSWGVQLALTLQVEEKTTINPAAVWTPPSVIKNVFTLGGSLTGSADATRIDKLNFYYTIAELRSYGHCPTNYVQSHPPGSLLIQSDLKLSTWLSNQVTLVALGQIGVPSGPNTVLKQNALSHEIKFEVITSGGISPTWKITRFTVDQSGTLFSTSRDRLHDLLMTLGPVDPNLKDTLAPTAQDQFFSSLLGSAVNGMRSGTLP